MSVLIGRYVCEVELDVSIDGNTPGLLPYEEIDEKFTGDALTNAVREIISREFFDEGSTVTVKKMYADVYMVEDGQE